MIGSSKFLGNIFSRIIVVIALTVILFPLVWIVSISLRHPDEVFQAYFFFIPKSLTFGNYPGAIQYVAKWVGISFPGMFTNSLIVTTTSVLGAVVTSAFAAYGFSQFKFLGKEFFFVAIFTSFAIPVQILLIPLFVLLRKMGILNTYFALILPYISFGIPVSTLILRSFFEEIPTGIKEAAKMDGASDLGIFYQIVLPLSKPALATCIIFSFMLIWNEFLFALVFISKEKMQTIPVALAKLGGGQYIIPWEIYTSSIMITAIPIVIVFLALQKSFIRGITTGALKG